MKTEKLSPARMIYQRFKSKYSDCVLFFRLGDDYTAFCEDAEAVSIACDLQGITDVLCQEKVIEQDAVKTIRFPAENKQTCLMRSSVL